MRSIKRTRGTIPPKLGKRRRRALIRLRHALAAQKFFRWSVGQEGDVNVVLTSMSLPLHRTSYWHQWHRLGCP